MKAGLKTADIYLYYFSGNWDVYVFSPDGRKFRSITEVKKFLDENPGIQEYDPLILAGRPPDLLTNSQNPRKLSIGPKIIKPRKEVKITKEGKYHSVNNSKFYSHLEKIL